MTGRPLRQSEAEAREQTRDRTTARAAGATTPQSEPSVSPPARIATASSRARRVDADTARSSLFEPGWVLVAPVMVAGIVLSAASSHTLPHLLTTLMVLAAIGLAGAGRQFARMERDYAHTAWKRVGLMVIGIGLPMFCFGLGIARWTIRPDGLAWSDTICVLIVLSTVATVILKGRLITVIAAQLTLWAGVAVVAGSLAILMVLPIGAVAGIWAATRQARADEETAAQRRALEHRQRRAEQILKDFEQSGQGWFWETDRRGLLTYVSPTIGASLGRDPDLLIGRPLSDLFILENADRDGERTLAFHMTARAAFTDLALRAACQDEERWWSVTGRPLYDGFNNYVGFRGSGHDLTEKRRSQENATRLAHFDSLTGLANRFQMRQSLERILTAPNLEHRACAVFLLDLDRFKQVNDTMGHPAGDALLKQVAERLARAVGPQARVGRLGGDEFEVILPGRHQREDLAGLARNVIHALSEPYSIDGHRVVIGVSVGVALAPEDGLTTEALVRNADLALYAAKDGGRGRHHFYASGLHSEAEARREIEQDLRDAMVNGELHLHYQPVVHTVTERITGFEALLRWTHPSKGEMAPAKFIPVAEDAGLIAAIGEWALQTACRDLAAWPSDVRVAVNVSPLQFANPALPAIVTRALAAAGVDPARLELEITESVFLNDDEGTEAMFASLKRVGVRLSLDDFGTGYSSLGYLRKAPFDKIKIDQSFVRGATIAGSRNGAIISSIVSLAEALGMETTAEGVETLDELDLVRMLGCSHVQGYIYAKPLDREAAGAVVREGLSAIAQGPRSARPSRQTMLRKIVLDHGGQQYQATIRNVSATGALIEGLWNVPPGTIFRLMVSDGVTVTATSRWCQDDRMGVEFASAVALDDAGRFALGGLPAESQRAPLRKAVGQ